MSMEISATPLSDVAQRILTVAEVLMAKEGVQNLSTHKIAKAAGLSVGTIYLHFKDKEDLLDQLVYFLFHRFHQCMAEYGGLPSVGCSFFEHYRKLWWANWHFLQQNPNTVMNIHQYESLPRFHEMLKSCFQSECTIWNQFFMAGKAEGILADLPNTVLFSLGGKVAFELAYLQLIEQTTFSDAILEEVILRTWRAMQI